MSLRSTTEHLARTRIWTPYHLTIPALWYSPCTYKTPQKQWQSSRTPHSVQTSRQSSPLVLCGSTSARQFMYIGTYKNAQLKRRVLAPWCFTKANVHYLWEITGNKCPVICAWRWCTDLPCCRQYECLGGEYHSLLDGKSFTQKCEYLQFSCYRYNLLFESEYIYRFKGWDRKFFSLWLFK